MTYVRSAIPGRHSISIQQFTRIDIGRGFLEDGAEVSH